MQCMMHWQWYYLQGDVTCDKKRWCPVSPAPPQPRGGNILLGFDPSLPLNTQFTRAHTVTVQILEHRFNKSSP